MNDEELTYVLRMRDEATRVLKKYTGELDKAGGTTEEMANELKRTNSAMKDADQLMKRLDGSTGGVRKAFKGLVGELGGFVSGTAGLYAIQRGIRGTVSEFSKMEDGLTQVRKTSGLSGDDLEHLKESIQQIGREVPLANESLMDMAATAGRAGLATQKEIIEFTKTAAQVSVALDGVDPEQLLRTLGLTREGAEDASGAMKQYAATLNYLDDTSKTSAERIMWLASEIAGAGAQFNLSYKPVLAMSTVMAEMNVDAGVASTTILRMGQSIQDAAAEGGEALQAMSQISNMTGAEFKRLAREDMSEAMTQIVLGLRSLQLEDAAQGTNKFSQALKLFELDAIQARKAINPWVSNVDSYIERLKQVNDETAAMTKFNEENRVQLQKYSAQVQLLKNEWGTLKATIGADFADAALPIVQALGDMIRAVNEWYNSLSEGSQKAVAFGAVTVGAIGSVALMIGKLGIGLKALAGLFPALSLGAAGFGTAALGAIAPILPWLALGGGLIVGLVALKNAVDTSAKSWDEYADQAGSGADSLRQLYNEASANYDKQMALNEASRIAAGGMETAAQKADRLAAAYAKMGMNAAWAALQQARQASKDTWNDLNKANARRASVRGIAAASTQGAVDRATRAYNIAYQVENKAEKAWRESLIGPAAPPASAVAPTKDYGSSSFGGGGGEGSSPRGGGPSKVDTTAADALKQRKDAMTALRNETEQALKVQQFLNGATKLTYREVEDGIQLIEDQYSFASSAGIEYKNVTDEETAAIKARNTAVREGTRAQEELLRVKEAERQMTADGDYFLGRMKIGFGETRENAMALAQLEREVELKARGEAITAREIEQARTLAAQKWDLAEAQRIYNEQMEYDIGIAQSISTTFGDLVTGATSFRSAISNLARSLQDLALQYLILMPMMQAFKTAMNGGASLGGGLGAMFGALFAQGGAFSNGVQFFAKGGVVNRPTAFGTSRGLAVMGEAGEEAVMPLRRDRNGNLGVMAAGGGSGFQIGKIEVNVEAPPESGDPVEFGKVIADALDAKLAQFTRRESRPGGMLWGR